MNKNLHQAKRNKNDEFYTRTVDIENELRHYKEKFKDKVVFLNCDDPKESNFWKYFERNFHWLGLKKLIATHYDYEVPTYKLEYDGENITKTDLEQNGDFRSPEAIAILKEADIVCTNPPFSLFREYIAQLVEYDKDFLIIGNVNATTYKETFPLIKDNEMWWGRSPRNMKFYTPEGDLKSVNAVWYTNMGSPRDREELILYREYDPAIYPKYDNYDAINVDRVNHIPKDYYGYMGVLITFMSKYNSDQFKIISSDYNAIESDKDIVKLNWDGKYDRGYIDGRRLYSRIIIQRKDNEENNE